jgi:hypothetical protein
LWSSLSALAASSCSSRAQVQDDVASQALPPPQRAKSAYALLALLLALLIALAVVVQRERESSLAEGI